MAIGLVYSADNRGFLYHAWVECYAGGQWKSFDPTFGQEPSDATHIRLILGSLDKQVELIRLSSPHIEILEILNGETLAVSGE
jgi:hypothetical protein